MHPSGVATSSTSFGLGEGGNVSSAGWQATPCDPMWHVSSRSGVACCELLYSVKLPHVYRTFKRVNACITTAAAAEAAVNRRRLHITARHSQTDPLTDLHQHNFLNAAFLNQRPVRTTGRALLITNVRWYFYDHRFRRN